MSHNTEPQRAAGRHRPAIIGIIVALILAAIAFVIFIPGAPEEDGIAQTAPEAGTPLTDAEGTGEPDGTPSAAATGEQTDDEPAVDPTSIEVETAPEVAPAPAGDAPATENTGMGATPAPDAQAPAN